jgi:ABC-type branched-subunit amino acid transport system substrate-binding protein
LAIFLVAACQNQRQVVRPQPPLIVDDVPEDDLPVDVKVGLLLPLTGRAADLGQDMLKAAEMALFDAGVNSVVLLPRDTGGEAGRAAQAARDLIDEGAELLIGPLFSSAVQAVTPVAQAADVRVLAFSNVTSVAEPGTYLLGFRPEEQIERVVQYALDQDLGTFAGLAPDDAYGRTAMQALQRAVLDRGGELSKILYYPSNLEDPSPIVREIANYPARQAALAQEKKVIESLIEDQDDEDDVAKAVLEQLETMDTFGPPPFDAILIADGSDRLRSVASLLTFYDVDPEDIQFLGTIRWQDDPRVLEEEALAGGWFAGSSPSAFAAFDQRFQNAFGKKPEPLASLAYDATALSVIVQRDLGDRRYTAASLTDREGFAGATGLFRLQPNGLAQHGLAVLEVADGSIREVDPTPARFIDDPIDDPFYRPGPPFSEDDLFGQGVPGADPVFGRDPLTQ